VDNKLNIYIVEDNTLIAASLKHMLISLGHNVCGTSATYKKAVIDLHVMDVDLVVTDIILEGKKNGVDLGKYIKMYLNIPLIYQSAVVEAAIINAALANCPVAYLTKPVSKVMLAKAIENLNNRQPVNIDSSVINKAV
jgi:two-component SAPR family response regulator